MPQFDLLTLGAQTNGTILIFCIFFLYSLFFALPYFAEIKKSRQKIIKTTSTNSDLLFCLKNVLKNLNNVY
uniref:ATPase subunit 8 n=1 Tax=Toxarium undulatum TaxID=210620 RepID=A0A2U9GI59_9STRA|nr:ATPase subunit 8 [Toxarium undulatum]AWQ64150.1 ATPase subunit 8 [Toxarium undulatum]